MPPRYRLKLQRLDFVSLVDDPAQPNAKCLLIKRRSGGETEFEATAQLVKMNDELGLAFFWAFTSTNTDGTDHFDLQGDNVVADDAMIKAAMSFMEKGGAVDEMHDSDPDGGRVVFAMPMTPEIAKAFGVATKTSGLMIAIKPSADAMAKLKDGTYRAVSIAGLGERDTVKSSGRVVKASLYTNEVDGHQHEVEVCDDGSLYVRYATSAGADNSHSHGIVLENGTLTILADSGHSHVLAAGQPGVAVVPADALVIVQASASSSKNAPRSATAPQTGATNSTPSAATAKVAPQPETKPMNFAKLLAAILSMSTDERTHVGKLGPEDAEAFVGKAAHERAEIVKSVADADPVTYTSKSTGRAFRRSEESSDLCAMTKQLDKQAEEIAKRDEMLAKAEIRKLAVEVLDGMPGDNDTHDFIIASLRKGGDEVKTQRAIETLKGMRAETKIGKRAPGIGGTDTPIAVTKRAAYVELEKGLIAFCVEKSIPVEKTWVDGLDAFVKTPAGAALYKAHDEAKAA